MTVDEIGEINKALEAVLGKIGPGIIPIDVWWSSDLVEIIDYMWNHRDEFNLPFKPYSIENWRPQHFDTLRDFAVWEILAERKYDGTFLAMSPWGIFTKKGNPMAEFQYKGLRQWAIDLKNERPDLAWDYKMLFHPYNYIVVFAELFGSAYTPQGFHKNHDKPWDLVPFEFWGRDIWEGRDYGWGSASKITWGEPFIYATEMKASATGIIPRDIVVEWYRRVRIGWSSGEWSFDILADKDKIVDFLNQYARGYEGIVIKTMWGGLGEQEIEFTRRYIRKDMFIAKIKWDTFAPDKIDKPYGKKAKAQKFSNEFLSELTNEVDKYIAEKGMPNVDDSEELVRISRQILDAVLVDHPDFKDEVPSKSKEKKAMKFIRGVIRNRYYSQR